jgi:hypothetical protein
MVIPSPSATLLLAYLLDLQFFTVHWQFAQIINLLPFHTLSYFVFCSYTYFCVFLYAHANFVMGLCAVKFARK